MTDDDTRFDAPGAEEVIEVQDDGPAFASSETRRALEAIVMVADEPADPRLLAQLLEVSPDVVEAECEALAAEYAEQSRGFELVKVAGGWRFQSHTDLAPYVERFVLSGQSARLSAAALETLAIVAYKQPISRAQVSAIRGVNVDAVMRTLHQRGYIAELARDPGPGQAVLFGTTSLFLEKLGLNGLDELPGLGDFVPGPEVLEALEHGLRIDSAEGGDETATVEADADLEDGLETDGSVEPPDVALVVDDDTSDVSLTIDLDPADVEDPGFEAHDDEPLDALEVLAEPSPAHELG
jgi:segregation and condensation protein B